MSGKFKTSLICILSIKIALALNMNAQSKFFVFENNANIDTFNLGSIQKITFPSENMVLDMFTGEEKEYALQEIRYFSFASFPGANNISAQKPSVQNIVLFPNPVAEHLNINYTGNFPSSTIHVQIFNINGQAVYNHCHVASPEIQVPVSHLPAGLYSCIVNTGAGIARDKFIKAE